MCWSFRLESHDQSASFGLFLSHSATHDDSQICRLSQEAVNLNQRSTACEIIRNEGASFVQEKVTQAHLELWHWPYLTHFVAHTRQSMQELLQVIPLLITVLCLFFVILFFAIFFFVLCSLVLLRFLLFV
jgi:hypothetical protein